MITVKEFVDKYKCYKQSVYKKIKRHKDGKLKEHISKNKNGILVLDDFAVEFLKTASVKTTELIRSESENSERIISDLKLQIIESENENDKLFQKYKESDEEIKKLKDENAFLKSENEKLKIENEELKNEKSKKQFSIFRK